MQLDLARNYLLGKPATTEDMPLGLDVLAFRASGKIVSQINPGRFPLWNNLKCDAERSLELREESPDVRTGCHMISDFGRAAIDLRPCQ